MSENQEPSDADDGEGQSPSDERESANNARIRDLEGRIARRNRAGVRPYVSLVAIGVCAYFLWTLRSDVAYVFASKTPITLGAEGNYHFDALRSNVYAQLHGIPTLKGAYLQERAQTWVGVGLQGTPVVVWRKAMPSEIWRPNAPPPSPNQTRFAAGGRLLAAEDAPELKDLFTKLSVKDGLRPVAGKLYVLREGIRPGEDATPLLFMGGLVFFILVNAALIGVRLRQRFGN